MSVFSKTGFKTILNSSSSSLANKKSFDIAHLISPLFFSPAGIVTWAGVKDASPKNSSGIPATLKEIDKSSFTGRSNWTSNEYSTAPPITSPSLHTRFMATVFPFSPAIETCTKYGSFSITILPVADSVFKFKPSVFTTLKPNS